MEVKLVVMNGPHQGRVIPLPPTIFMVGRASRCHLRLHSLEVSKLHCAIATWAGKVVVRDLKSVNGTFVNGRRVHGEVRVLHGDTLHVGAIMFTFCIRSDSAEVPPVPVVHEGDVKWLIDTPAGPQDLAADETNLVETAQLLDEEEMASPAVATAGSTGELSAGQGLRDYFRQRKLKT